MAKAENERGQSRGDHGFMQTISCTSFSSWWRQSFGEEDNIKGRKFYYGRGCDRCNNTGHRGRMGIFELVLMNDEIRDMISAGASTDQLRVACIKQGMIGLRESGLRAIFRGHTTIEEVVRETVLD